MKIEILEDANAVALKAAAVIAAEAWAAVTARGRFVLAVSGGHTPWHMLRALAGEKIPWQKVHVMQVDERIAAAGHPDRNLTHLRQSLLEHAPLPAEQIYAMPVEDGDLEAAAANYASTLQKFAGCPPALDLAHLGLGPDGHTASLVPGDPVPDVMDKDVALTGTYQERRRMTLTYPILNRALRILWLVTGAEKVEMLSRLLDADQTIPAGRINQEHALVLADVAAAENLAREKGGEARTDRPTAEWKPILTFEPQTEPCFGVIGWYSPSQDHSRSTSIRTSEVLSGHCHHRNNARFS